MKLKLIDILLIVVLICLGLAVTLPGAGRAIWYDEACTVDFVKAVPDDIVDMLAPGNNMPAYFFLMKAWTGVFGFSETALRMPSMIMYLISALLVYLFGKRLFPGRGPGFIAAVFYLLMIINTSQAISAKPYSMLALLSVASLWLFYEVFILENKSRLLAALFITVNITGTLIHVWFFFSGAGQVVYYLAAKKSINKKFLAVFAASFLAFFAVWGTVFIEQLSNKSTDWMQFKGDELISTFGLFTAYKPLQMLLLLGVPILAGFFMNVFSRQGKKQNFFVSRLLFLAIITLSCLLLPYFISFIKPVFDPGRGPVIAAAPFALLAGGYLCSISYKPVFFAFFTLIAVYMGIKYHSFDEVDYYNAKTLTRIVINYAEKYGKAAIYGEVKREINYYLNFYGFNDYGRVIYNPDFFDYRQLEKNGKIDEHKKRGLDEKFAKQLEAYDGSLVFVFNENEPGREPFDTLYAKLNSSRKILKKGYFCGAELVVYK